MRVDIRVPVGSPIPDVVEFIRRCEEAGFGGVGVHDHHHTGRDAYVTLALAATQTNTLRLYPTTSNPVSRHPLLLATLINSLFEIGGTRVFLTVAPGFLAVEAVGARRASLSTLRQSVVAIRRLLTGGSAFFSGHEVRLRTVPKFPPKVIVLASGPRMIELAGEVADGALMLVGVAPQAVDAARSHLFAGAQRAGRDPGQLDQMFIVPFAVAESKEEATSWPRRWFRRDQPWLHYPSTSNLHWLAAAGIKVPDTHSPSDIPASLAEDICNALGAFGRPEDCAESLLSAREEAGIQNVFLFPAHDVHSAYDLPVAEVDAFTSVIRPRL